MELNNMRTWAIELVGTMLLVTAWLWTHGNPYVMGIVYTVALVIAKGHFSPLITGAEWALHRIPSQEAAQYLLAQVAGASLAVVATPALGVDGAYST